MIVVKSKVKEVANGASVSADFVEALNEEAHNIVNKAMERAKANGRKTVQARDVFLGDMNSEVMLVVKSKAKALSGEMSFSADFFDGVSEVLAWCVAQGALRAEANKRKTIQARDL